MTDKKDGPARPAGGSEPQGKRPVPTIDLKVTEVRSDETKPKPSDAPSAKGAATADQSAAAARVAAAAKAGVDAAAAARPTASGAADSKPADKPASTWSVESALGERKTTPGARDAPPAAAVAAQSRGSAPGRFLSHAVAGVLGGLLALLGAQHGLPLLGLDAERLASPPASSLPPDIAGRLAGLERTLRERLAAAEAPRSVPALDAGLARIEELGRSIATLADAQSRLAAENAALREALAQRPASADAERLATLEEQLKTLAAAAGADPQRAGRIPQLAQLVGQVRDLETALNSRLAALRKELAQEVDNRIAATAEAGETAKSGTQRLDREVAAVKSDAARLAQRIDQLKTSADRIDEVLKALKDETGAIKTTLEGFRGETDTRFKATARPADLARAVDPIAAKLTELEKSLLGIVRAEDDRKSNAERIVLSLELGNLKRAMERGARYAAELAEVRRVAGDRLDLKALERYQGEGVPTLATLTGDFRKVANAIVDAEAEQPGASVVDRMLSSARTIVRVRRSEYAANDVSAEAIVARMEAALKEARLSEVLAEASRLTEKARTPAIDWLRKVEARQAVDVALAAIDTALKSSLGAGQKPDTPKGTKR